MDSIDTISRPGTRRPIKARGSAWAAAVAGWLVRRGVTPNSISVASIAFSVLAAAGLVGTTRVQSPWVQGALFVLSIGGIQGRLLCNLFDGMVAVEGGKKSLAGELFNDVPDRIADPIILVAAGYAAGMEHGVELGWAAAVMSLLTAYARVLGRSVGAGIYFIGPMAKQHRMAVLTTACAAAAVGAHWGWHQWVIIIALGVIILGSIVTVWRRLRRIATDLEAK